MEFNPLVWKLKSSFVILTAFGLVLALYCLPIQSEHFLLFFRFSVLIWFLFYFIFSSKAKRANIKCMEVHLGKDFYFLCSARRISKAEKGISLFFNYLITTSWSLYEWDCHNWIWIISREYRIKRYRTKTLAT